MYPSLQRLKLMKENSAGLIVQQFHTRIYRKLHLVPEIILNVSGHNELRFPWALQRMKSGGITAFCDITKG